MEYLAHLAEPDTAVLQGIGGGPWDFGVAIPSLREGAWIDGLLDSLERAAQASGARALALVVVNRREGAPEADGFDNQRTLERLSTRPTGSLQVVAWDRTSPGYGLGPKDGVGTARKIGADALLALWKQGRLRSPVASTTDGDARVDSDYFSQTGALAVGGLGGSEVGYVHRFRHEVSDQPAHLALVLYELYLRHYVLGLRHAGSPYAFHTIGSLLAFSLPAYERCRGFPRRQAGEDFYLLDKLAKIGAIAELPSFVRLEPRPSDRVPFGTGAAMARIDRELKAGKRFRLFPDTAFGCLGTLHATLDSIEVPLDGAQLRKALPLDAPALASLEALGFFRACDEAHRTRRSAESYRRHLLTQFGSLKTFQWIRHLSGAGEPPEFREGLRRCAFLGWEIRESVSALELLERLRRTEETQAVAEAGGFCRSGMRTVNRLPLPTSLST